ncbi:hypothetical protein [Marinoscillum furvescens]|uniref:Uncharacterized protein n=1 Tax=Marinoscillum furvescens DSM 4134 TaxID=1122208 RepID=A0A3D9L5M0_MARFU|nr:hypothetical protein [Marinoscillum furvescens]REE00404.1 hypothetical protein C7460_10525 [Marinoscillum furvescens DSM 4134]
MNYDQENQGSCLPNQAAKLVDAPHITNRNFMDALLLRAQDQEGDGNPGWIEMPVDL